MNPESDPVTSKSRTLRRLNSYWRVEALNVLLIPFVTVLVVSGSFRESLRWTTVLCLVAVAWLLIIGAIALRMMYLNANGNRRFEQKWVPRLYHLRLPSILLVAAACLSMILEAVQTLPAWSANLVACGLLCLLAAAEYVNYFHVQVQHFDHAADFQRLLAGRGFRPSHLARAIRRWKNSN